jgi:hypothetical protein
MITTKSLWDQLDPEIKENFRNRYRKDYLLTYDSMLTYMESHESWIEIPFNIYSVLCDCAPDGRKGKYMLHPADIFNQ